eukprot:GHVU01076242.1.p1 GENE.GHVU01076242.1~~GHVU01076242.1.p1  ORF type:complete len:120 (+),score=9.25 GHVU01076242.1:237-596(+)
MEIVNYRRVSKIPFQLGTSRLFTEGVLDSAARNCWISTTTIQRLRAAGERVQVHRVPEGVLATSQPAPSGFVEVQARIWVTDDIWIEAGPVPFLIIEEATDFVLIAETTLEELERLPTP